MSERDTPAKVASNDQLGLVERLRTDVLWHQRRGNETIARDCQEAADELERLRAALAELLACHTESAGWSMSMLADRAEFDAMLSRSQERLEAAVGAARVALGA